MQRDRRLTPDSQQQEEAERPDQEVEEVEEVAQGSDPLSVAYRRHLTANLSIILLRSLDILVVSEL